MKRAVWILTLLALALCLLAGCGAAKKSTPITELSQLREPGRVIGVGTGTGDDEAVKAEFPDAKIQYLDDSFIGYNSVANGRLDAFVYGRHQMELAIKSGTKGVKLLDGTVGESHRVAVGLSPLSPIPDLEAKINSFLDEAEADGTLDDMYTRWVIRNEETMPEIDVPAHAPVRLRVATTGTTPPYTYYVGTDLRGYDIELARRFAAWLGAELELTIYDYSGAIAAAQGGDTDCIMAEMFVTPERAEALPFSQPIFLVERAVAVRDLDAAAPDALRWQDYNGRRLGVLTGTLLETAAKTYFPDSEYLYFNDYPDCNAALLTGKIDAYLGDEPNVMAIHAEQPKIDYIHDRISDQYYSFAFRKNDPKSAALCAELNEYLARARADGTLQELNTIWMGTDEEKKIVDLSDLTDRNGTVRVVTTSSDMPWSYIKDGKHVGYDIDLVARFCRDRGYALVLGDVDYSGRIPAVQSGKYDFSTDMNVTPEREEQVLFSDPTSSGGIVLAVLASAPAEQSGEGFWASVASSFEKTFLRENRWKLFLEGIGTTLLITALSIALGTALGFIVFLLCRSGNRAVNAIARFCVWLVQGMPMVVLLMILYYIIFGKVAISGMIVSIIGFTLVFGAAMFGMLRSGVGAIDRGQTEAAYALGYTDRKAFFRVVLPQALPHFMPAYKGEITATVKATAIVGYVAVQDLTKMGDIVRSRTYEAFFPLLAVAVIYFLLAALLTAAVNRIELRIDPRKRKREDILKGVTTE